MQFIINFSPMVEWDPDSCVMSPLCGYTTNKELSYELAHYPYEMHHDENFATKKGQCPYSP